MTDESIQLRVRDLLHALNKRKYFIIGLTLLGVAVGLIVSGVSYLRGDVRRSYMITASVALNSKVTDDRYAAVYSSYPNNNDYHLAEDMVDAAIYILSGERTMTEAINRYNLNNVFPEDVKDNLTLTQYEATLIIEETLYWSDAAEGTNILNAINDVGTSVLQETMNVGGINVINPPSATHLLGGNLNVVLCLFLGVMGMVIGTGLAILELLLRPTLLNPEDIQSKFRMENLGSIPFEASFARYKGSLLSRDKAIGGIPESFASVAHILRNLTYQNEHQCIFVTSAARTEGKTMAVANLAIQLAETEKKVLMIDFNFSNPGLSNYFVKKTSYENSLNALYRGEINELEAITTLTGYLDLLPCVAEARTVLSIDSGMIGLVKKLCAEYDYVLIDTEAAGLFSGTLNLSEVATGAIMVVRYDMASNSEIESTIEKLKKSGIKIIGGITNAVKGGDMTRSKETVSYSQRRASPVRAERPAGVVTVMDLDDSAPTNTAIYGGLDVDEPANSEQSAQLRDNGYTDTLRHLYNLDEGSGDAGSKKDDN